MPCNCRQCDCSNRALCYLVQSRLNSLACILDKVADSTLPLSQSLSSLNTNVAANGCGGTGGDGDNGFYVQGASENVNILGDLSGLTVLNLIAPVSVIAFVEYFLCIPGPDASGFCLQCNQIETTPPMICGLVGPAATDSADLMQYVTALAQNLRYWADIYGC